MSFQDAVADVAEDGISNTMLPKLDAFVIAILVEPLMLSRCWYLRHNR